jgi:U1 zinc finger
MPRFFDDYSHTYLTHDSSAGRKQQRRGWKFRENFKAHVSAAAWLLTMANFIVFKRTTNELKSSSMPDVSLPSHPFRFV